MSDRYIYLLAYFGVMSEFGFKSTKDLKVPSSIIEQVIGQDDAVRIVRKASRQRRHVLLIGEPGTGKSLLGMALAELLPKETLVDIVSFSNPNDENQPMIRVLPVGQGRDVVARGRLESAGMFRHQNVIMFVLLVLSLVTPWWAFNHYSVVGGPLLGGLMFLAFFVGGLVFLVGFVIFLNFNRRIESRGRAPKLIVDSFGRKQAPFLDATGAHAGALLGDVLHDPFQTFSSILKINFLYKGLIKSGAIGAEIDRRFAENRKNIVRKGGYEAVLLPENNLFVAGEKDGSIGAVEVLSANRYDYDGEMVKFTTSANEEIVVTPEHKIAILNGGRIEYIEAAKINENDEVVTVKDSVVDEGDIINTYDAHQQEQCRLYYEYCGIKAKNPAWGYKRISKAMGQNIGKTRWWHEGKHIPVPIQAVLWLKGRGLLPLKIDNPKLPLIAKVLGATFGDGGVFENLNGIFLSSSEKVAVEEFGKDLEELFGLSRGEYSRISEGGVYGHSWCYQNTNRNIIQLFLALGAPRGNKTKTELKVPFWITLNCDAEKEFYGSLFGSELGTPIIHKKGNCLTTLEIGITGVPHYRENRIRFLNEVADYLKRNRVNTTSIYEGKYATEGSSIFRLLIEKKFDNMLLFLMNVKINYCRHKVERLYKALGELAALKIDKYNELVDGRGYGAEHAMKILNLSPNSLYLLLNNFGQGISRGVAV